MCCHVDFGLRSLKHLHVCCGLKWERCAKRLLIVSSFSFQRHPFFCCRSTFVLFFHNRTTLFCSFTHIFAWQEIKIKYNFKTQRNSMSLLQLCKITKTKQRLAIAEAATRMRLRNPASYKFQRCSPNGLLGGSMHSDRPTHICHTLTSCCFLLRKTPNFPGYMTCKGTECGSETHQFSQPKTSSS